MNEPPKFYCPYCGLEMKGKGHLSEDAAWHLFECEYDSDTHDLRPRKEIDVNNEIISKLQKNIKDLKSALSKRKARKLYLESIESD